MAFWWIRREFINESYWISVWPFWADMCVESMWFGHKPMWEKIVPPNGKIVKRGNHSDSIILIIG